MKILKSLLFCFSLILGSPSFTLAATYIVDKSGAGDFTTIQAAVDQAAAEETTGPSMGYAYFTHGSDIVSVWGGLPSLQSGMLISVDDRNWYEIVQIIDGQTLRITRAFDENNRFNNYKAVTVSNINIRVGIYHENINLENVHFIRFEGVGQTRESVTIQPPETTDTNTGALAFRDVQDYGALYFKNLTVRNISVGPIITTANEGAISGPRDTNLSLKNVHFDAQCCDVILSAYGHVLIENSKLESENDVLGGFFKSLTVKGSDIMSERNLAIFNAGKAIFVRLLYNSLIEDSLILTKAHDPANPSSGNGMAISLSGTNGNTLTIRNSVIVVDGGQGGIALSLGSGSTEPSKVSVEGSRLLARSRNSALTTTDIQMRASDSLTAKCTEYATVTGGGTPVVLSCP